MTDQKSQKLLVALASNLLAMASSLLVSVMASNLLLGLASDLLTHRFMGALTGTVEAKRSQKEGAQR